jgi:hypothetical protein
LISDPKKIGRKKNERIKQMVSHIETVKSQYPVPAVSLAAVAGISASSYKRWKRRICCRKEPVQKPGVKKVASIDLEDLKQQIDALNHGKKRTAGTGRLYLVNRHGISRRDFNEMVRQARTSAKRSSSAALCRVCWLRPDLAWALDGLQYATCYVHNLQDLCSRYKFAPMTCDHMPCGEEVAGHLDRHFTRFGPPLFIKRDNGGNLNHRAVNAILEEQLIIPINNPCYSASYNGAIEHSQGELKTWIGKWKSAAKTNRELALLVENAVHALNHNPRRSLSGSNACRTYFVSDRFRYSKRQRRQAWDWIRDLAAEISAKCAKNKIDPAALRIAARKWLEKNNLIIIDRPKMGTSEQLR